MSIEVRPLGVTCNLRCTYCYEEATRAEQGRSCAYDKNAVMAAIERLAPHESWSLFGGEALLLPLTDLEELLAKGFAAHGRTSIQTNGTLITDAHVALFRTYKTHVGISLDGPPELNDSRWAGTSAHTRDMSQRSWDAVRRLCETIGREDRSLRPGLIITLHAGNCATSVFPRFLAWLHEVDALGVPSANFHIMEMDYHAHTLYLPQEELAARLIDIWRESESFTTLVPTFIKDILDTLRGDNSRATCTHRACDPLNTQACKGIEHDGAPSGCNRLYKDGVTWLPAEGTGKPTVFSGFHGNQYHIRQIALYHTPQEYGGCQGCEYWLACQGNCSGEGQQGDWRRRSSYCYTHKALLAEGAARLRAVGIKPLTLWQVRPDVERYMLTEWTNGNNPTLKEAHDAVTRPHGRSNTSSGHVDHWDAS